LELLDTFLTFISTFYGPTPYLLVFGILLACGLGLPIPEDITLFVAGMLSYTGVTDVWMMIAVSLVGVILGDSLIFWLGATYGRRLTKKWFFHKLLPDDRLEAVRHRFHTRGDTLLFFARFMPGLRAPIFFSAGTLHIPYRKFILLDGGAALISVPLIVGSVYYYGDEIEKVFRVVRGIEHGLLLVVVTAVVLITVKWYITHRKLKRAEIRGE